MPQKRACPYCNDANGKVIRFSNFKHYWHRCTACGTMWRENKTSYPLTSFLHFIEKVPLASKIGRRLFPSYLTRQNAEEDAYQNYGKLFHMIIDGVQGNEMFEVKKQRYLSEASDFLGLMEKNGLNISSKKVLDISGGPGTFAYFIKPDVGSIVVTEYGENSVNAMAEYLNGIKVIHADINEKWPDAGVFDIVLYRSCLYFCNNFDEHLRDINHYLQPNGIVYICTTAPSLGNSLRWQYEDYTHNVFYSRKVVEEILERNNFTILEKGYTDFYPNFLRHYSFRDKLFHCWGIWNLLRAGAPKNLDARAHWILARKS